MGFTLQTRDDHLWPVVRCDQCGVVASGDGFLIWDTEVQGDAPAALMLAACRSECLDELLEARSLSGVWAAIPLDAYLANLIRTLGIDIDAVLARERAALAAERTRYESPE